jgi:hypothetical protein
VTAYRIDISLGLIWKSDHHFSVGCVCFVYKYNNVFDAYLFG